MADTITLHVARYRPEAETEPTFQEYQAPCRKDWVVLDALNYIKDKVDGTLSFRWSCRMGICGSCGMTVNGEPKLTCATFLTDYAPGPVRVEPLRNFPIVRDLVIEMKYLTTISQEGESVILELINRGFKVRCRGVFAKHVLKQLTRRANGNLREMKR